MIYLLVQPEVPGHLAASTRMDNSTHPPRVDKLHIQFDGWLGDELLEVFPTWIVSTRLASLIRIAGLTGCYWDEVTISTSEQFYEIYGNKPLPSFERLMVKGVYGETDFFLDSEFRLIVSSRAWSLISGYCSNAEVSTLP